MTLTKVIELDDSATKLERAFEVVSLARLIRSGHPRRVRPIDVMEIVLLNDPHYSPLLEAAEVSGVVAVVVRNDRISDRRVGDRLHLLQQILKHGWIRILHVT